MKAAVYYGKHNLVVEDVPVRELKDNEVLIQVKYCGVCGTDVHIFNGDGGSFEVTPPLIPGHEFSGVVKKIGANVNRIKAVTRMICVGNVISVKMLCSIFVQIILVWVQL